MPQWVCGEYRMNRQQTVAGQIWAGNVEFLVLNVF